MVHPSSKTSLSQTHPGWDISLLSNQGNTIPTNLTLVVIVNLSGANIPFASLRKTSIVDSKEICTAFTVCVEAAMSRVQGMLPSLFYSKEDIEMQATKKYTAHIARAVARLIRFSSVTFITE